MSEKRSSEELVAQLRQELAAAKLREEVHQKEVQDLQAQVQYAKDEEDNQERIAVRQIDRAQRYKGQIKKHQRFCPLSLSKGASFSSKPFCHNVSLDLSSSSLKIVEDFEVSSSCSDC